MNSQKRRSTVSDQNPKHPAGVTPLRSADGPGTPPEEKTFRTIFRTVTHRRILLSILIPAAAFVFFAAYAKQAETKGDSGMKQSTILITIGSREFTAELEDNAAADALRKQLPLDVTMREFNGNEKYVDLPERLPERAVAPGRIRSGDLMLYGSSTLVLFYDSFPTQYRYTRLGRVTNPVGLREALGQGNPTVRFSSVPRKKNLRRTASDGAVIQRENPAMPTRVLKKGTRINLHFGKTVIPAILNDSETARALLARLPLTQRMTRYSHDFCGGMESPLPYREDEVHYGWLNGDIDFARDGNYFTILFEDEKNSGQYGHQINIGVIACELSRIASLRGSYDVRIERAE